MDTEWHDSALHDRREWLGDAQPRREDTDDDPGYVFTWGAECDAAIAVRRALDTRLDGAFAVAEQNGIAIVPAYDDADAEHDRRPHPLMELAYSCDDTDWIVVTRQGTHAAYTADVLTSSINSVLAPCRVERHDTPSWCVLVTHHG